MMKNALLVASIGLHGLFVMPVVSQAPETVAAGIDVGILNDLIPSLQDDFFPGLIAAANDFADDSLTATAQEGTCCMFGDVGVSAEARIFNFILDPLTETQISIQAVPAGTTRARIRIAASNLNLQASATASAGAAAVVALECSVGATATVFIPSVTVGIDIESIPNSGQLKINPTAEVSIPSVVVALTPTFDLNICSPVSALLTTAFNTISLSLSALLLPFLLDTAFPNYLSDLIGGTDQTISLADIGSFPILETAVLTPMLDVQLLQSSAQTLRTEVATSTTASLTAPAYRAGRSLEPVADGAPLPDATLVDLVSVHLSFPGLNSLIETMWYAAWASFASADDSTALDSVLCEGQATATDACPFPPIIQQAGFLDALLLRLFFLGSFGFYKGFSYELLVPPPTLDFASDLLEGTAQATAAVYGEKLLSGKTLLATVTSDAAVTATLPTYDSATGVLSNFELSSIDLVNPQLAVEVFSVLKLFQKILISAVDKAVDVFSGELIGLANSEIAGVFSSTPLKIPDVPGFPTSTQTVTFTLTDATVNGVASGTGTSGFLDLDSGLSVSVLGAATQIHTLPFDDSMYKNRSYKTAYDWALESENPNAIFSYSFNDAASDTVELYSFRWTESGVESKDSAGDWMPAAPPLI